LLGCLLAALSAISGSLKKSCHVGYELDFSPLANKIGIVIGQLPSTFDRLYNPGGSCEVLWLYSGEKMMVAMKHLQPAYILKDKSQTSE